MKPILLSTEETQEALKNQTLSICRKPFQVPHGCRRIDCLYRDDKNRLCALFQNFSDSTSKTMRIYAPYQPGDILYVREAFFKDVGRYMYRANYSENEKFYRNGREVSIPWNSPILMPREAARLFLRVTKVRPEKLHSIANDNAATEESRRTAWNQHIKKADLPRLGWNANPWVWVIASEQYYPKGAV